MFFSSPAAAKSKPDCEKIESVYCDTSWRGFSDTLELFQNYETSWSHQFDRIETGNHVYIWVRPPFIPTAELTRIIDKGAKILVFDETDTTLNWYRDIFSQKADVMDSPDIPEACHINGNPNLPVFEIDEEMKTKFHLKQETIGNQIALNHPTPIVRIDSKGPEQLKATFSYAYHSAFPGSDGALFVIRDESLLTRLMLKTLDNKLFILSLVEVLCGDESICTIHLFDPEFQYSIGSDTEQDKDDFLSDAQKAFANIQEKGNEAIDNVRSTMDTLPLFFMIFVLLSAWAILAFAAAFSWGRTKPKS